MTIKLGGPSGGAPPDKFPNFTPPALGPALMTRGRFRVSPPCAHLPLSRTPHFVSSCVGIYYDDTQQLWRDSPRRCVLHTCFPVRRGGMRVAHSRGGLSPQFVYWFLFFPSILLLLRWAKILSKMWKTKSSHMLYWESCKSSCESSAGETFLLYVSKSIKLEEKSGLILLRPCSFWLRDSGVKCTCDQHAVKRLATGFTNIGVQVKIFLVKIFLCPSSAPRSCFFNCVAYWV